MSDLITPGALLAQVLNQLDPDAHASALTMSHNQLLAAIVNAVSDGPDVSQLQLSETALLAALLTAVGGSGSNLTSSRAQLLAGINNALSDGADLSPLATSEGALFQAAFQLVAAAGGGGADRRVTSTGAIRVTSTGAIRTIQMGAAPTTDPNFANVVLLLGFEGADASTVITDQSPAGHAMTAVGDAQLDTSQFRFGASALQLDGTGDFVTSPDSADWDFGVGEFTVEAWCRFSDTTDQGIVGQWGTLVPMTSAWSMYIQSGSLHFRFIDSLSATRDAAYVWPYSINTWYHVAADRNAAGDVRLYIDGVTVKRVAGLNQPFLGSAELLRVGRFGVATTYDLNGWVDELRVTKGVARYASDIGFAVPTAAYPRA